MVLRAGADKVSLNTAAIRHPELIRDAARIFGSSTIAVSIEAIRQPDGTYLAFTDNGRVYTGKEVLSWAKEVENSVPVRLSYLKIKKAPARGLM